MQLTKKAVEQVKKIIENNKLENPYLKAFIASKSCSGISYGLDMQSEHNLENEILSEQDDLKIVVNKNEEEAMKTIVVDFVDTGDKQGFVFSGGDKSGSCGSCGSGCH